MPPPNDTCLTASVIASLPATIVEDTTGGGNDPGGQVPSCQSGANRFGVTWQQWVAPEDGTVVASAHVTTMAGGFGPFLQHTYLSVWTGTCGTQVQVQCSDGDDQPSPGYAYVQFVATEGETYYFQVSRHSAGIPDSVELNLSVAFATPPTNTTCADATVLPNLPFSLSLDVTTAVSDPANPCPSCAANCDDRYNAVWFQWLAPFSGRVGFSTFGSTADTLLSAWSGVCGSLVQVACSEDDIDVQSVIEFDAVEGQTYYLQVSSDELPTPVTRTLRLYGLSNLSAEIAMPITVMPATVAVNVSAGSNDLAANPCPGCAFDCASRFMITWYAWTASAPGTVRITTELSHMSDTLLSVWTGTPGSLVEVACSEDDIGSLSEVILAVTQGTVYYIQVSSYYAATDEPDPRLVLGAEWWTPANGTCLDAAELTVPVSLYADTTGLPADAGAPCPSCANNCGTRSATVWYKWVAPDDGFVQAGTIGSDYDTLLSIWTGACGALVQVACSEDDFGNLSALLFEATQGTTYYIQISSSDGSDGRLQFQLSYAASAVIAHGDLVVGNAALNVYDGLTGALTQRFTLPGTFPDIGAQDADGNLYIPVEQPGYIVVLDPSLVLQAVYAVNGRVPHCFCFNEAGSLFIGYVGFPGIACGETVTPDPDAGTYSIRRYSTGGVEEAVYDCDRENGGTQHIDLMPDQAEMLYTSLGRRILAYDVVADTQLADFAVLPDEPGALARGLRILPDETVLVVDKVDIKRIARGGSIVQRYSLAGQADWGTISLAPNAATFWVANRADGNVCPPMIAQFNVDTGALLQTITDDVVDTGGAQCSGGMMIYDGYRAAAPPQAQCEIASVIQQPSNLTVSAGTEVTISVTVTPWAPAPPPPGQTRTDIILFDPNASPGGTFHGQAYRGQSGDRTTPVSDSIVIVYTVVFQLPPVFETTDFWIDITQDCPDNPPANIPTNTPRFTVPRDPPQISGMSSDCATTRVTLAGTNFQPGASVTLTRNGTAVPFTLISLTLTQIVLQLASIPAGTYCASVAVPTVGTSNEFCAALECAAAAISNLAVDCASSVILVTGTGFVSGLTAVVTLNGVNQPTISILSVTATQVRIYRPGIFASGQYCVNLTNPGTSPSGPFCAMLTCPSGPTPPGDCEPPQPSTPCLPILD